MYIDHQFYNQSELNSFTQFTQRMRYDVRTQRMMVVTFWVLGLLLVVGGFMPRAFASEQAVEAVVLEVAVEVEESAVITQPLTQPQLQPIQLAPVPQVAPQRVLSPIFTLQVQQWETEIVRWSAQYHVDPNHIATIMQVESCGNPNAISPAGAQGLFQVMPFHFETGEPMLDPDTNARRGLSFLTWLNEHTEGDIYLAMAGYNGGLSNAWKSMAYWPQEMVDYKYWTTGLTNDIANGLAVSPTLTEWLAAGGENLCDF